MPLLFLQSFQSKGRCCPLLRPLWLPSQLGKYFHHLWSRCPGWWRADLNVHIINLVYRMPGIWLVTWKWKWNRSVLSDSLWPSGLYSLPGSSIHRILQARILEWVAISFSTGSSQPRDRTQVSYIGGRSFNLWVTWVVPNSLHLCSLSYCPNLYETLLSLPIAANIL